MARPIETFTGTGCVVGRGWCEPRADLWYAFAPDGHDDRATTYYIDHEPSLRPDLVCDFGEPLPDAFDARFAFVRLEYLPTFLFEPGKSALANAVRMLMPGGTLEIQSSEEFLKSIRPDLVSSGVFTLVGEVMTITWDLFVPAPFAADLRRRGSSDTDSRADSGNDDGEEMDTQWVGSLKAVVK